VKLPWRRRADGPGIAGPAGETVAVYFAEGPARLYQLEQWLTPLAALAERVPLAFVLREDAVATALGRAHPELVAYRCRTLADLTRLLDGSAVRALLYVNNAQRNFQALAYRDALHVHVNHGESDKDSVASNQVKAYDRVLVPGQAGIDRYTRALIGFDASKLRAIGRPQLDRVAPAAPPFATGTTVLYAPTWEGGTRRMDYSSVAVAGLAIVRTILERTPHNLVYRPHPATGTASAATRSAHTDVVRLVRRHPHRAAVDATPDINALFPHVDFALFDNSAAAVDHLATGKPYGVVDPGLARHYPEGLPPFLRDSPRLSVERVEDLPALIEHALAQGSGPEAARLRPYYLGVSDGHGTATGRFVAAMLDAVAEAERLIEARGRMARDDDGYPRQG